MSNLTIQIDFDIVICCIGVEVAGHLLVGCDYMQERVLMSH